MKVVVTFLGAIENPFARSARWSYSSLHFLIQTVFEH